jgi:hypothetical protein
MLLDFKEKPTRKKHPNSAHIAASPANTADFD